MSVPMKYFPRSLNEDSNSRPNAQNLIDSTKSPKKKSSSSKILSRMPQSFLPKDQNKDLLFKLKPTQISIDKEQLFQENLQLKLKNHSLLEDLTKYKTKLSQLELELSKKEKNKESSSVWDKSQSSSFAQNLKQTVKELKANLDGKEKEIFKLKLNLKCSRTNELEAELQAYIDECTRLRHHLEETLKNKAESGEQDYLTAQALDSLQNDKTRLETLNKNLQNEINGLKNVIDEERKKKKKTVKKVDVNQRSEIQKLKIMLLGRERELKDRVKEFGDKEKELKEKEEKLKNENNSLKAKLENAIYKLKQGPGALLTFKPSAPYFFTVVNACVAKLKGLKEFLEGLKHAKTITQIFDYIRSLYPQIKQSQIIGVLDMFRVKNPEAIHDLVREWFYLYDYTNGGSELGHEPEKLEINAQQLVNLQKTGKEIVSEPVFKKVKSDKKIKEIEDEGKNDFFYKADGKPQKIEAVVVKEEKMEFFDKAAEKPQKIETIVLKEERKVERFTSEPEKSKIKKETVNETPPNEPDPTPGTPNLENSEPAVKSVKSDDKSPKTKTASRKLRKLWEKLAMALQINRVPKEEFINFLPDQITKKLIAQLLISEPFNFSKEHSKSLAKSFFSSFKTKKVTPQQIFKVFQMNTEDWEIFSEQQEAKFNQDLTEIVENFKSDISNHCKTIDKTNSGQVSLQDFQTILKSLHVSLSLDLWKYLKLLFYSCNEELDQVPYTYFLENFGQEENTSDEADQEIASKVRTYIEKIAERLIEESLTVPEAFSHTNSLIFPQQFVASLQKLGLGSIPEGDIELMLQALQYEESDETCILLEELQDILSNYGVAEDAAGTQIQHSLSKDEETLKIGIGEEDYEEERDEYSEDFDN